MPKVQAWQCKHTGKLFPLANENEYKKHTARAYRNIVAIRKMEKKKAEFQEWLETEKAKCRSPKQVAQFLTDNFHRLAANKPGWAYTGKKPLIATIELTVNYREECSNSHSCPHNGVTNWHRHDDKPKSYPGLYGRINVDVKGSYPGFLTDYLSTASVWTGSGGSGKYDVTLFLDDWPSLKAVVEEQKREYNAQHVINVLAGKKSPIFHPVWED